MRQDLLRRRYFIFVRVTMWMAKVIVVVKTVSRTVSIYSHRAAYGTCSEGCSVQVQAVPGHL